MTHLKELMYKNKILVSVVLASILIIMAAAVVSSLWKDNGEIDAAGEFRIIETLNKDPGEDQRIFISYIPLLFLNGYYYSPSSYIGYSPHHVVRDEEFQTIREEKLGEVTLDLKGLVYEGVPPDFSSTYDIGTKVYTIKNVKKDRAVIVVSNGNKEIFYRLGKELPANKDVEFNLKLADIFKMISDFGEVSAVELRAYDNGAWMRTSTDATLISLINSEIPRLSLYNLSEIDENPFGRYPNYIPINLMFEDGGCTQFVCFS